MYSFFYEACGTANVGLSPNFRLLGRVSFPWYVVHRLFDTLYYIGSTKGSEEAHEKKTSLENNDNAQQAPQHIQ